MYPVPSRRKDWVSTMEQFHWSLLCSPSCFNSLKVHALNGLILLYEMANSTIFLEFWKYITICHDSGILFCFLISFCRFSLFPLTLMSTVNLTELSAHLWDWAFHPLPTFYSESPQTLPHYLPLNLFFSTVVLPLSNIEEVVVVAVFFFFNV